MTQGPFIELDKIRVAYASQAGIATTALEEFSLVLGANEIVSVVGPSGSGKSTLLSVLAGIKTIDGGTLAIPPNHPKVAMMFQRNPLFPWMSVEENLSYPLRIAHAPKTERKATAQKICELLGLDSKAYLKKFPRELSGGEERRVALGMCLAHQPDLLLLDEPSTGLDDANKWRFQELLQSVWSERPMSVVVVTHDIEEAIMLGSRVVILQKGHLKGEVAVGLPYPRTQEVRFSAELATLRKEVAAYL